MSWSIVLLKRKELGSRNVMESWKKALTEQDVSIIFTIDFHCRLDENQFSES